MTTDALAGSGLGKKEAERSKNMFTLGLLSWMYHRPTEGTVRFLERQFRKKPEIAAANIAAFRAGFNYGETTEAFAVSYEIKPAPMAPGTYRNISGNQALAYGLVAAGQRSGLPVFLGAYPITPASDVLHELSKHKAFGVRTFQAEDEIAGIGAALGASFGGALGVTTTSGPGVALKGETIGLAVMTELPLVIVDVQRGGPSTGLPTKTEQSDLLQALFGRNGEAPVPVVAPRSPGGLLRRGHRGRPDRADLPDAGLPAVRRLPGQRRRAVVGAGRGHPARPAGGVRHRAQRRGRGVPALPAGPGDPGPPLGGPGHQGPAAPDRRAGEGRRHGQHLLRPGQPRLHDPYPAGQGRRDRRLPAAHRGRRPRRRRDRVAVIGWGSTYGPIGAACRRIRRSGRSIAQVHLRHLNPLPADLGDILRSYDRVVCPEMNLGQLSLLLRAEYLVDVQSHTQVRGLPFRAAELAAVLQDVIDSTGTGGDQS